MTIQFDWSRPSTTRGHGALVWHSVAALLLLSVATSAGAQAVRPAAGVRVVRYGSGDGPTGDWRLEDRPRVVIGGSRAKAGHALSNVAQVTELPDGKLAVGLLHAAHIRVFDSAGAYQRTIGDAGQGRGHFESLWQLFAHDGALIGVDGFGVAQVFALDGRHLRTDARPRHRTSGVIAQRVGYLADGGMIAVAFDPISNAPLGRSDQMLTLLHIHQRGQSDVGRFPGQVVVRTEGGRPSGLVFGPRFSAAVLPRAVCIGFSNQYAINCFAPDGTRTLSIVRADGPSKPIGAQDRELYFAAVDSANPLPAGREVRADVRSTTAFADRRPQFGRMLASARNELWVGPALPIEVSLRLNAIPDEPTVWSVYSATGEWLSNVTIPRGVRLMAVGRTSAIGLAADADGQQRLLVYQIDRRGRARSARATK